MAGEALLEHSPVGPSSLSRVINCPASVWATKGMADTSSEFANEGSYAHLITELARNEGNDAKHYLGRTSEDTPWQKDDGTPFECNQEMVAAVQDFLDYCEQWGEGVTLVEQRVTYDAWIENGWGTSDHILILPEKKVCVVIDFKYGKGIKVNSKKNDQLMGYALGTFQEWGDLYDIDEFILCVSQPRIGGHRDQWVISTEDLLEWAETILEPAGKIANSDDKALIVAQGFKAGEHCRWCKIKSTCMIRANYSVKAVTGVDVDELDDLDAELPTIDSKALSDEQIGQLALKIDQIKKWCGDLWDELESRVNKGLKIISGHDSDGEPEYWKHVEGRSNRKFSDPVKAEAAIKRLKKLKTYTSVDAKGKKIQGVFNKSLITITQLESAIGNKHKLLTEPLPKENEDDSDEYLIVKPKGKAVMVPGDDNREPIRTADVDEMDDIEEDDDDTSWLD